MDYLRPGPDNLPGPDFNKQVYEFDDMKQIWHQSNYTERVKVEAEILVTLEALKTSTRFMHEDTTDIKAFLSKQYLGVKSSKLDKDTAFVQSEMFRVMDYTEAARKKCIQCEHDLNEARNMLILYCQQFAFAPEMASQCAAILNCH